MPSSHNSVVGEKTSMSADLSGIATKVAMNFSINNHIKTNYNNENVNADANVYQQKKMYKKSPFTPHLSPVQQQQQQQQGTQTKINNSYNMVDNTIMWDRRSVGLPLLLCSSVAVPLRIRINYDDIHSVAASYSNENGQPYGAVENTLDGYILVLGGRKDSNGFNVPLCISGTSAKIKNTAAIKEAMDAVHSVCCEDNRVFSAVQFVSFHFSISDIGRIDVDCMVPSATLRLVPIAPITLLPLTHNFSESTLKERHFGYISLKSLPSLLPHDDFGLKKKVAGVWVSGVDSQSDALVWAACTRFLHCDAISERIVFQPGCFILILISELGTMSHFEVEVLEQTVPFHTYTGGSMLQRNSHGANSIELSLSGIGGGSNEMPPLVRAASPINVGAYHTRDGSFSHSDLLELSMYDPDIIESNNRYLPKLQKLQQHRSPSVAMSDLNQGDSALDSTSFASAPAIGLLDLPSFTGDESDEDCTIYAGSIINIERESVITDVPFIESEYAELLKNVCGLSVGPRKNEDTTFIISKGTSCMEKKSQNISSISRNIIPDSQESNDDILQPMISVPQTEKSSRELSYNYSFSEESSSTLNASCSDSRLSFLSSSPLVTNTKEPSSSTLSTLNNHSMAYDPAIYTTSVNSSICSRTNSIHAETGHTDSMLDTTLYEQKFTQIASKYLSVCDMSRYAKSTGSNCLIDVLASTPVDSEDANMSLDSRAYLARHNLFCSSTNEGVTSTSSTLTSQLESDARLRYRQRNHR